jgi:hypothetical protein
LFKIVSEDAGFNRMLELLEAERGVAETNRLIEHQRLLIEQLGFEGYDTTSAWTVFDSLLANLALYLQERHRLRAVLNSKGARPAAVSRHYGSALKRLEYA